MEFACGLVYVPPLASQKDSPRGSGNPVKRSGGIFFLNSCTMTQQHVKPVKAVKHRRSFRLVLVKKTCNSGTL